MRSSPDAPRSPLGSAPDAPRVAFASSPDQKQSGQPVGSLSPRLSRAVGKPAAPAPKPGAAAAAVQEPAEPKIEELWAVDFGSEDRELTLPALIDSIRHGEVKNDTLVWRVGMPGWQSAAEIAELAGYFAGAGAKPDPTGSPFDVSDDKNQKEKEVVAVASSSDVDADVVTSAPTPALKPAAVAPAAAAAAAPKPAAPAPAPEAPAAPRAPATPPALPTQTAPVQRAAPPPLPEQAPSAASVPTPAAAAMAAPPPGTPGGPILSDVSALLRAQEARKKMTIVIGAAVGVAVIVVLLILMATSGGTSEAPPAESSSTDTPLPIATKPKPTAAATDQPTPAPQGKSFSEMFAAAASANSGAAFDAEEARNVVEGATARVASCRGFGSQPGSVSVEVSFAPRGMAISAKVGPPYGGTPPGTCMESALKSLRVKPFSGPSGSLKTTLHLP